jgi:hypothetical protein
MINDPVVLEEPEQPEAAAEMLLVTVNSLDLFVDSVRVELVKLVTVTVWFVVLAPLPEA